MLARSAGGFWIMDRRDGIPRIDAGSVEENTDFSLISLRNLSGLNQTLRRRLRHERLAAQERMTPCKNRWLSGRSSGLRYTYCCCRIFHVNCRITLWHAQTNTHSSLHIRVMAGGRGLRDSILKPITVETFFCIGTLHRNAAFPTLQSVPTYLGKPRQPCLSLITSTSSDSAVTVADRSSSSRKNKSFGTRSLVLDWSPTVSGAFRAERSSKALPKRARDTKSYFTSRTGQSSKTSKWLNVASD